MSDWRDTDSISVSPQRRFKVRVECLDGRVVTITVTAGSMDSVIDQVTNRRIATPPDRVSFSVSEDLQG
ncbi:hypothetical protein ACW73L_07380 [Methylolobus aquaticus]